MKITRKSVATVIEVVVEGGAKQATLILDPSTKVTATRVKKHRSVLLTMGKLNYRERKHIKRCKARGESFKKIIIKQ